MVKNLIKKKTKKNKVKKYSKEKGGNPIFNSLRFTLKLTSEVIIATLLSSTFVASQIYGETISKVRKSVSAIITTMGNKTQNLEKLEVTLGEINNYTSPNSHEFIAWIIKYIKIYNNSSNVMYLYAVIVVIVLLVIVTAICSVYPPISPSPSPSLSPLSSPSPEQEKQIKNLKKSVDTKYKHIIEQQDIISKQQLHINEQQDIMSRQQLEIKSLKETLSKLGFDEDGDEIVG